MKVSGLNLLCWKQPLMERMGILRYAAPELLCVKDRENNLSEYDERIDVWSIGILAYKMISGKYIYNGSI